MLGSLKIHHPQDRELDGMRQRRRRRKFPGVYHPQQSTKETLYNSMKRANLQRRMVSRSLFLSLLLLHGCNGLSPCVNTRCRDTNLLQRPTHATTILASSFYDDFEDFGTNDDDEDDEDDDDEYEDELNDAAAIANFRSRMGSLFGDEATSVEEDEEEESSEGDMSTVDDLISYATSIGKAQEDTDWARPTETLEGGVVLLANPARFCTDMGNDGGSYTPSPALLSKFGLTLPPPADLGPDRRADLLPVLVVLERHPIRGSQALLLNRRTGYLLGDLEQPPSSEDEEDTPSVTPPSAAPKLGAFMIQPLWFGGTSAGSNESSGDGGSGGLDMLHVCPAVVGAKQLTDDGLYWGGDPAQAQEAMNDRSLDRIMTGFDFKFFVQSTRWFPLQLEKEVKDDTWFVASVSKEVLFKSRDRMGTKRAKPLWTEVMELLGGEYKEIRDKLYRGE